MIRSPLVKSEAQPRPRADLEIVPGVPTRAVIAPGPQTLKGEITAQPSKNYTTRYLLAAALGEGKSTITNIAASEDAVALQHALTTLGAEIAADADEQAVINAYVTGFGGKPQLHAVDRAINVGNAGAVLRLLLGIGALLPDVTFITDRPDSLGKRPNADLLKALEQLGCGVISRDGMLPITLHGGNLHGGLVTISGARSSQFLSSLLFLAPLIGEPVEIVVTDQLVSKAPVRQTIEVLARAGVKIDAENDLMHFRVAPQNYYPGDFAVNGDWPGSAAILAAAAVTGSAVRIHGLLDDNQGEKEAAQVLRRMAASILSSSTGLSIEGGPLDAVEFDGDLATDAVLALMGAACFAKGRTRFYNVANLRLKECDRISEPLAELRKLGVQCWEGREVNDPDPDAIIIEGNAEGYEGGIEVDGRKDHRVIMLETIIGLRCRKGLTINGAEHVAKSYPDFFRHMGALGADITLERLHP